MKVICICAQKGGQAKTTTSEACILGLRNKGYRVLGIDLDQSANLTNYFIGENYNFDAGDLISGKVSAKDVIKNDIVPGGNGLIGLPALFEITPYDTLRKQLKQIESVYDYVIIDTAPTSNKVVTAALSSSDYVIVPCEPAMDSVKGCNSTLEIINLVQNRYNPNLKNLGILLVKYKDHFKAHSEILNYLKDKKYPLFKTTIRESQAINNAKLKGDSFFAKEYNTAKAVYDYHNFVREVLEKVK